MLLIADVQITINIGDADLHPDMRACGRFLKQKPAGHPWPSDKEYTLF